MRASGAGTSACGPSIVGNGSKRAKARRIGPEGGSTALSSRRIAERWIGVAQVARAGGLERDRAADPDQQEAHAGDQHAAADAVEHAQRVAQVVAQPEAQRAPAPMRGCRRP